LKHEDEMLAAFFNTKARMGWNTKARTQSHEVFFVSRKARKGAKTQRIDTSNLKALNFKPAKRFKHFSNSV
jgi:hypothetical protein